MSQIQQHHIAIADAVTLTAAFGSGFAWVMGWLPGVVTVAVGLTAIAWYVIQILDSNWWQKQVIRRHRRKLRKHRASSKLH